MDAKQLNTFGEFIERSIEIAELCMKVRQQNCVPYYDIDGIRHIDENFVSCRVSQNCGGGFDVDFFDFPVEYFSLTDEEIIEKEQQRVEKEKKAKQLQDLRRRKQREEREYEQYLELKNKFE